MRPLKLTMTAFGPYRDFETIDFSLLQDQRLFVISGNTGAGKTTIFDAICFAVYGTASGEDRSEARMLRSQFADEETHTAVEFDFAIGRRSYRVFRQMKHRKGANKSETGEKTELYELMGDGRATPIVDRFITTEVNAKLLSIVGLTKEQFSQIVMLPQGEFRKLLTSDTDNKEDILRRIFQTELYEKLEAKFHAMNRELQEQLKEARAGAAAYMKQAEEALPQREGSQLALTLAQESYNALQMTEALELEAAYYEEQSADAQLRRSELSGRIELRQSALNDALALNQRHDALAKLQERQRQSEAERPAFEAREKRLALAEKAAKLTPYEEQAERAKADCEAKRGQLGSRRERLAEAERLAAAAEERYAAEAAKEEQRRETERELHKLTELAPLVRSLAKQHQTLERLQQEEQSAAAKHAAAEAALAEQRARKQGMQLELQKLNANAGLLADKLSELSRVQQQGKQLTQMIELDKELARISQLESHYTNAMNQAKTEYNQLEQLWIEGQAGMLAVHLHDGKPCPVCGSESHPAKQAVADDVPSREQLQQAKEQLSVIESELHASRAQAAAAKFSRDSNAAELADSGIETAELEVQQAQLRKLWRELKDETDDLQKQAQEQQKLGQQLHELEQELDKRQTDKERLQQHMQQLVVERTKQQSVLEQELERIPAALRTEERMAAKLAEQQKLAAALELAWRSVQEQRQQQSSMLAEAKAHAEQAAVQHGESMLRQQEFEARLKEELALAGFQDVAEYRLAAMSVMDREALKSQIDAYRSAAEVLAQQIAQLEQELQGKPRADTAGLQTELAGMRAELEHMIAASQTLLHNAQEARRLAASIKRAAERVKSHEAKLEEVLDVYQMLKGDNASKISFERYILIEYLEQILHAANARLAELSNGQFTLERSDRLEKSGKQSGLGLDVYDAYTGQNRDVKTLSGGEKFNASLCLALGMTDVIQSHQGGVTIEMMFIDEGFGSLDEESLGKAINTLVDLQKAGRMIGVISHVQELKDAFPACLEVHKTKEGYSRTRIVVK
ncbi:AAA family ATPase [Paenibacillus harenae]|uniref:Nuclease SbcCD subunit C n=1 Tax=Paenibacillus harenae TaxID=306543 RepID=A0ABT9U4E2_PAEHA|nr:SMC family ATPase [Paenibacillus harenae]MDQ0114438.1 exonuclease SbcC [Paenibacillus harenae]